MQAAEWCAATSVTTGRVRIANVAKGWVHDIHNTYPEGKHVIVKVSTP